MSMRLFLEDLSMPPIAIPACWIPLSSDLLGKHPIPYMSLEEGALRAGILWEPVDPRLEISHKRQKESPMNGAHALEVATSNMPLPYASEYLQITATRGEFQEVKS